MAMTTSPARTPAQRKQGVKDTLVLRFKAEDAGVKSRVYRDTLEFIAAETDFSSVYSFRGNQDLLSHVLRNKFHAVVMTNEVPCETALLLKGLGLVQIIIGLREDLVDICDIVIDPLITRSERYFVGPRFLLPSLVNKYSADTLARLMGIKPGMLLEDVRHSEAGAELLRIVRLYHKLDWDSAFFGMNIGYISCLRLTPNIERHLKKFIRREKIDLVEYLCNCHDRESVATAERNGYSFVDIRITLEQFLDDRPAVSRPGYEVRKGTDRDIKALQQIATGIYRHSRYFFDENFDRDKAINFYVNWVEKAIRGEFDDFAYVLYDRQKPIGFCTIRRLSKNSAIIGLFGLHLEYVGAGLGRYLLNSVLQKLKAQDKIDYVEVVTQGRNYEAQRLYQRCGFITKSTEMWYHKWLH